MNKYRVAGNLLIASFIFALVGSFIFPNEVWQVSVRESQIQILVSKQMQVAAAYGMSVIVSITSAMGFIIFSRQLRTGKNKGLSDLAAGVFFLGALFGGIHYVQIILDPGSNFHTNPTGITEVAYAWFTTVGLLLYGVLFLREGYTAWFGYLTIGLMVLMIILILIYQQEFYDAYLPQFFYLLVMIMGIIIKRR
jgi:hypothetical protein